MSLVRILNHKSHLELALVEVWLQYRVEVGIGVVIVVLVNIQKHSFNRNVNFAFEIVVLPEVLVPHESGVHITQSQFAANELILLARNAGNVLYILNIRCFKFQISGDIKGIIFGIDAKFKSEFFISELAIRKYGSAEVSWPPFNLVNEKCLLTLCKVALFDNTRLLWLAESQLLVIGIGHLVYDVGFELQLTLADTIFNLILLLFDSIDVLSLVSEVVTLEFLVQILGYCDGVFHAWNIQLSRLIIHLLLFKAKVDHLVVQLPHSKAMIDIVLSRPLQEISNYLSGVCQLILLNLCIFLGLLESFVNLFDYAVGHWILNDLVEFDCKLHPTWGESPTTKVWSQMLQIFELLCSILLLAVRVPFRWLLVFLGGLLSFFILQNHPLSFVETGEESLAEEGDELF